MSDTVYKLTRADLTTYNGFRYEPGQLYAFPGTGPLCAAGWSHAYLSPETAVLHNPIHGDFDATTARLWRAEGVIGARDGAMKVGCSTITLVEELPLPKPMTAQCVAYAIAVAWPSGDAEWRRWAADWIAGRDRGRSAAAAARAASEAAAWWAAEAAAAWAASAAARWSAAAAAWAAWAAEAAWAEARWAAAAARSATWSAAAQDSPLLALARWACAAADPFVLPELERKDG